MANAQTDLPRRGGVMTFPEAVEEILAIAIATYLDGQRRERLKEAIELSVRTLDEWDRTRLGVTQEQLGMLISWAKTRDKINFHIGLQHQHTEQVCVPQAAPPKPEDYRLGQSCPVGWTQGQCEAFKLGRLSR